LKNLTFSVWGTTVNGSKNLLAQLHDAGSNVAWVAAGVFGLGTLYLLLNITINGPKLRAAADAALAQEIDQENDAFCQKYGMLPRTEAYQNCKLDLIDIRRRESERWAADAEFF
jgi:hypothetical protein